MEIVATPRRSRRGRLVVRGLAALAVLLIVLLLTPAALGLERHVVHDDAMVDSLPRGSLVFTDRVPVQEIRVGDVITFRPPGDPDRLVTRRIVELVDGAAVTKGDSRTVADPWLLPLGDAPARVAVTIPWLGYPWLMLTGAGPLAWALLAGGAGALVIGGRLRRGRAGSPAPARLALAVEGAATADASAPLP